MDNTLGGDIFTAFEGVFPQCMVVFPQQVMATVMTKHPSWRGGGMGYRYCPGTSNRGSRMASLLTFVSPLTLTSAPQAPQQSLHSALSNLLRIDIKGIQRWNRKSWHGSDPTWEWSWQMYTVHCTGKKQKQDKSNEKWLDALRGSSPAHKLWLQQKMAMAKSDRKISQPPL